MTLTTCTRCGHERADHKSILKRTPDSDEAVYDIIDAEYCTRCDCIRELA